MKICKIILASFSVLFFMVLVPLTEVQAAEESKVMRFNDNVTAKILSDNQDTKVVETKDEKNVFKATYNKKTGIINIVTYDLEGNFVSEDVVDNNMSEDVVTNNMSEDVVTNNMSDALSANLDVPQFSELATSARAMNGTLIRKKTYGDDAYGYWVYQYKKDFIWVAKLRNGVAKSPIENTKNIAALNGFKSSVDSFISFKNQMVVKVGSGILGTITLLYLVPEPVWTKILAGLLTVISSAIAYSEGKGMYDSYMESRYQYARIPG
ncbi:geobacillin-26 family protein [Viridibacillus arvi]|uniref:geobacillin-26 family protein n=1 Tax=Viridibacillus arvi TaxID=263475 RepID=UPI00187B2D77|nr:geobacillin-26 family protein [Viridibacillus sp. JNUCC-6]QOV10952.1 geobacillin-26 family protein [Viridibacillus sp. JNUCC-6]